MATQRRIGAFLLIVGYLGVVAGSVAWMVSWSTLAQNDSEVIVYQSALAVGIGLAGLACWRWTVASRSLGVEARLVRSPTRWMAAASVAFAAGFAADTYQTYDNHLSLFSTFPQATCTTPLPVAHFRRERPRCRLAPGRRWILDTRNCIEREVRPVSSGGPFAS